jgi:glycosyltransferase involved in cell wall biosynthesis
MLIQNIAKTHKITLLPSSIRAVKDPLFIFPTIVNILKERDDHIFVVMGAKFDEKLYEEMINLRDKSNLQNRIIIHDAVEHSDFLNLLHEVDLVVNCSISEGMSNAIMEAMLLGVPVLARGNEGNKKLIKHMENGLIFNNEKEFLEFYDKIYNEKELREMITNNSVRDIKEKYEINSEAVKYKEVLDGFSRKYYQKLEEPDQGKLNLIFSQNVHPFSSENNDIFRVMPVLMLRKLY